MKNNLLTTLSLMTAITLLSSCGTLRKNKSSVESEVKTEKVTHAVNSTTITEKADTTVYSKPDSVETTGTLIAIERGDTLRAETENTSVEVFYDPTTGKVHATAHSKPQAVEVKIDKTTVSNTTTDTREKFEESHKSKTVEKERDSGMNLFWWGFGCGIGLVVLLLVAWKFLKTYLKTYIPFI